MTAGEAAIVGMAGLFGDDLDLAGLWNLVVDGGQIVRRFSRAEMLDAGAPESMIDHPDHVPYGVFVPNIQRFDANFFQISPGEARIMDPQHRVFLETAYSALADAGWTREQTGRVGVYASTSWSTYLTENVLSSAEFAGQVSTYPVLIGNDKDYIATRLSYALDLTGPSLTVQTACSSSLVAVDMARRALATDQCDLAVVGAVSLPMPQGTGYMYKDGGTMSRDGRCRPFDVAASGMVRGAGCGVVVLKRVEDALRHGDQVYAVVAGSATNNDGRSKMSYAAPAVAGQVAVIKAAMSSAGIRPTDVGYVEAHGTGTYLGDPVEVAALRAAYANEGETRPDQCVLGSVKANIGHLDAAAGVVGLIKVALVLHHQTIPPQVNFREPNPLLKLDNSPFTIATTAMRAVTPLRAAAVTSLGVGGTNAHCVLTPAPRGAERIDRRPTPEWSGDAHWIDPSDKHPRKTTARSATEDPVRAVLEIIRSVLCRPEVGPDDDFFEVGGDSLLGIEVVAEIRDQLDPSIRHGDLFERRTARRLAQAHDRRQDDLPNTVCEGTSGRTVFLVPPAGGTAAYCHRLVEHSSTSDTIRALSFPPAGTKETRTVEALAEHYLRGVRAVQPYGPYHLGGYSFGGVVAFEMALQLERAGEAVGSLLLFDAPAPGSQRGRAERSELVSAFPTFLRHAYGIGDELSEKSMPASVDEGIAQVSERIGTAGTTELRSLFEVWHANSDALSDYRPQGRFTGEAVLFIAGQPMPVLSEQLGRLVDPRRRWWPHLTGKVRVISARGDHFTMWSPGNLPSLAASYDLVMGRQRSGDTAPVALMFPGQGMDTFDSAPDLLDRYPRQTAEASDVTGYRIADLFDAACGRDLGDTLNAQPAIYVLNALRYRRHLDDGGEEPAVLIGHSLGEYNALQAAGAIGFADGLRVVVERARQMATGRSGGMMAVRGLAGAEIGELLTSPNLTDLDLAVSNGPDLFVLSGPSEALRDASDVLLRRGAAVRVLRTSGPFHSRYMTPAAIRLAPLIGSVQFRQLGVPVIANVTARPYQHGRVATALLAQIDQTVLWSESIAWVLEHLGDHKFTELGQRTFLTQTVKRIRESGLRR